MAKEKHLSSLDRAVQLAMGENRHVGRQDDPGQQRWPELWKWMSCIYYGANKMRQPSSLAITLGPDGVIVRLTDRDLSCSVTTSCSHLEQALDAIESALNQPNIPLTTWGKKEPHLRTRKTSS